MPTYSLTAFIDQKLPDSPPPSDRISPADMREVFNELLPRPRTGPLVTFDRDADYDLITSGTFQVDVAATPVSVGAVVFVYLAGSGTTAPSLPADTFELVGGAFRVGVPLMFAFRVRSGTKIQYTITQLPA
jgi:hypothetical protein